MAFELSSDNDETAYLYFPNHPGSKQGVVSKSLRLDDDFVKDKSVMIVLDYDAKGEVIGVEVVK